MGQATLSDVASLAGVSPATASRVISGSRPVGREIQARVTRAAEKLGYTGNSIARALRKQRTDTVGMIVPSILNPFFTTLVDSMERALNLEGKQLLLCDSREDPRIESNHLRSLIDRHVDGLVVSPTDLKDSRAGLAWAASITPLVQLDRFVEIDGTDWVGVDDDAAMRLIVAHLRASGTRTAAFVTSTLTNSSTEKRLSGFRNHCFAAGIRVDESWVKLGTYSVDSGDKATTELLALADRPEAIVCADDLIALGALRGCRRLGISVPGDMQITGFDNIVFSEHVSPSLTTVDQPTDQMASEALRLLNERASNLGPVSQRRISLTPTLVLRESTR